MRSLKRALWPCLLLALVVAPLASCTAATPAATPAAKPTPAAAPAATSAPTATSASAAQDKPLDPPFTVKLGILPIFSVVNIYTAIEKGFYKEQGLNIELINFDTAAKMTAPLTTGDLHAGAGAVSAGFFNAIQRGLPLRVVADWNSAAKPPSTLAFVARKDLADSGAIKTFADWKGKTVSINATGVFSEILFDMGLKSGSLTAADVKQVIVPFDQVPIAMSNKSVDVALTNEPFVTMGIDQGVHVRWKDIADLDPGRGYSVILYSPVFVKDNPEAAKRWMLAYMKGVRYYTKALQTKEGKAEIIGILGKYLTVKDPTFYERVIFPYTNPDGYVNAKSVAADLDWYLGAGQVKEKQDLSVIIDNQYVEYAIGKLGKYQ